MRKKQRESQKISQSSESYAFLDIIVPVFNQMELARKAIASVEKAAEKTPHHFIIVNNGSGEPGLREWISEFKPPMFHRISLKENQGYPGGVNAGAKVSRAPLLLVLSTDVEMMPGSIDAMVKTMDDPSVGVVGPILLFPKGTPHGPPERVQHAGIAFGLNGKPFHIFMGWNHTHPKVAVRRDMQAVTGACFMTRRNLFLELQGFNELYGSGMFEDMEYCFLVRGKNRRVVLEPEAIGYHYVGASAREVGGFNLMRNESIFRANVGQYIQWDEWRYW